MIARTILTYGDLQSAPVEVVSPSSSDIDPGPKLELYARHGIPEYWLADPSAQTITAYVWPSGSRHAETRVSEQGYHGDHPAGPPVLDRFE